jgi:hypothetical protein
VVKKALTEMNIQIANAISDITGVSGMKIVTAILDGERDHTFWRICAINE